MEFRLLGPLEALEGGRALPLGGPRPKALLARLLLEPNHVIPAERLIDDLWTGQPPPGVRTTLQAYVSRLRKLLGADTIETRGPGYALDATRFE